MPRRSITLRLDDMIEAAARVRETLGDLSIEALEADWQRHWLIQRGIEIISEASRHLPVRLKERHPEIPWTKVAGIGNVLRTDTRTSPRPSFGSLYAKTCRCSRRHAMPSARQSGMNRRRSDPMKRLLLTVMTALALSVGAAWADPYHDGSAVDRPGDYATELQEMRSLAAHDQERLAQIALSDNAGDLARVAALKLTDKKLLAKVALEAKNTSARLVAIGRLTDQAVLARIATDLGNDSQVRYAAETNLTDDEVALEKIALTYVSNIFDVTEIARREAIQKVASQAVLLRIAQDEGDGPYFRALAVASLKDKAALKVIAEDDKLKDDSPVRAVARLKLAIQESRIVDRLPKLHAIVNIRINAQSYISYGPNGPPAINLVAEYVDISLVDLKNTIVRQSWRSDLPKGASSSDNGRLVETKIEIVTILTTLLQSPVFDQTDLADLSASTISEVRNVAIAIQNGRKRSP